MINILLYFIGIIFIICFYIVMCLALGFVVFVLPIIIIGKETNTKAIFSVVAKKDINYNPIIIEKIKIVIIKIIFVIFFIQVPLYLCFLIIMLIAFLSKKQVLSPRFSDRVT